MNFKTEKKDGKLYITISIETFRQTQQRASVRLRDVIEILRERKIKHGACLQSVKITNRRPETCKGVFIFELPKAAPKKVKIKPQTTKRKVLPKKTQENS